MAIVSTWVCQGLPTWTYPCALGGGGVPPPMNPPYEEDPITIRQDLIGGTIDSLIHAFFRHQV